MRLRVVFLPAARLEMFEAQDWCEVKATGLGARFRDRVAYQVERMSAYLLHFPEIHGDIRRARVREFPYGLFFRVFADRIVVIACFHASREPLVWQNRV